MKKCIELELSKNKRPFFKINGNLSVRHLGNIRNCVQSPRMKIVLLTEMVARTIKLHLRWKLREQMKFIENGFSEEPFKQRILDIFNLTLRKDLAWDRFWTNILNDLKSKYPNGLTNEESIVIQLSQNLGSFLDSKINMELLFKRLISICGVKLNASAQKQLFKGWIPFVWRLTQLGCCRYFQFCICDFRY